jgi:hypothetical protein
MTATTYRPSMSSNSSPGGSPGSLLAVEQLLSDLRTDASLQRLFSEAAPDRIVAICQERGVYVSQLLLEQFITQVTPDEDADEELSLDQLEDVAGGLGIADVMVSGAMLAVVASNAGGLMSQAQAAIGGGDGPVASLTADSTIAGQVNTLESLGIQVVVGEPTIEGATAQWDAGSRTMTISAETMNAGAPAVLQAMNHESVHVAQSCKAGGVGEAGTALGIATSGEAAQAVSHDTYAGVSAEEKQMELEAYTLTNQAGAGVEAAVQHCSG